jgi:hypothetical protein
MRLRVDFQAGTQDPILIAFSRATTGFPGFGGVNVPRGVAVSPQGVVLTSLPVRPPGAGFFQDVAVAIGAGFPEDPSLPPTILLNFTDLTSRGMTADAAGNFYIATGVVGSSACGAAGSGAIVFMPSTLNGIFCFNVGPGATGLVRSNDVAIDPRGNSVLVTFTEGLVVRF